MVNESFAKKFNLGANPVGRMMATGRGRNLDIRIVGLVKDSRNTRGQGRRAAAVLPADPAERAHRVAELLYPHRD